MKKILSILILVLCFFHTEAQNRHFSQARFHQPAIPSTGDADSAAYINALISAGYTPSSTEKTAVGRLISDWKGRANGSYATSDIWTSIIKVGYPVLGSTAAAHAINVRSSSYVVTWNGTVTHTSNYYQGDASTGYGNTGFNPNGILSAGQGTLCIYVKTITSNTFISDIGTQNTSGAGRNGDQVSICNVSSNSEQLMTDYAGGTDIVYTGAGTAGAIYTSSATSNTDFEFYKNGVSVQSNLTTRSSAHPNFNFFLCAINFAGTAFSFSDNKIGFAVIGDGMTSTQNLLLYNSINAFNTAVGK